MKLLRTGLSMAFALSIVVASGCGGVFESIFGDGDDPPPGGTPTGPIGFGGNDSGAGEGSKPCTGLCLRQKSCASGTTSLSGTVMDPAGKVPLYNVLVYVPNAPVAPITNGATCDRCGSVSGDPLVTAITGVDGKFKLDNVPVGADIPLVVQIGKWRRQLVIPNVPECVDTPLNAEQIRLPRRKSEGDIPQIALTTGGADVMECWLRKVGLADEEFTTGTGTGKVHFYAGVGTGVTTSFQGGSNFSPAQDFWATQASLMKYDIVILSCEGITSPQTKPAAALDAMKAYANAGGRVFASHWHRYWFNTARMNQQNPAGPAPSPFEDVASWNDRDEPPNPSFGTINTGFPKGQAMHDWLAQSTVNALCPGSGSCPANQNDKLRIEDPRHNVDSVNANTATSWITVPNDDGPSNAAHQYISFNTPIPAPDADKCGRVVYSDLHVTTADEHGPWPNGCKTTELTPQEKALEFMLFDLSSCIQSDKEAPTPPPGVN
jgi:hypothetical protein